MPALLSDIGHRAAQALQVLRGHATVAATDVADTGNRISTRDMRLPESTPTEFGPAAQLPPDISAVLGRSLNLNDTAPRPAILRNYPQVTEHRAFSAADRALANFPGVVQDMPRPGAVQRSS